MDCDLVNKCLDLIHTLEGTGAMVHFIWIPSHVVIPLNEKADRLAQCALQDDTVDLGTEYTLRAQCLDKIKEGTKIPPRCCNCGDDHNVHSTLCTVRPRPQREPATDEVSRPRLVFRQAPPPQTNAWATKPSFSAAAPPLSQPSCPTTGTSTTPAVFPPLPQHTATVPQAGNTQELPATDATQQLMAVVSALGAKVDNLTATVSGLSTEFAAFKNQQHTVCSGTATVAPTPSLASGAQQGQGESAVCQHSLCDPPKKKDNAAGQCATAAAPTPRMDTPAKPVKGATRQPRSPSGMALLPPASESK
ncbi:mucin-7-like [Portunus trituberculatus]|uniref:mucin-7-like n=1 Tax=Portunus trituberculatus TaxID=210409 RepID=UPI001E1D06FD|nr:mucin-7-like [Portunus trituberculatus]